MTTQFDVDTFLEDEEPDPREHEKALDKAYADARAITEPLVRFAFLLTATTAAGLSAWRLAKRNAARRMRGRTR